MDMFKRTSRVIAIVLTLCMVFTMNSAVFAATASPASDNTFTYVTMGASQTNGYGMRGYLDEEVYQNPDKFDKNTANVFGYERAPENSYPALIAKQIKNDTGKTVDLRQLAMSSMRAEEVRMLLDETYNGDDYTKWRFSAGHNWFDRAGGVDKLRADYKDAVTEADLVTVEVGVNNFGVYAINQIISGGKKFDTDLADITAPDKLETYKMIKGMITPMLSDAVGADAATVELLADTFSYAYVGYKTSFDAIIAKIRELNPDTQIVVLGIPNMLAGVEAEMNGSVLPLGDLFGYVVDLGNLYASTESPYLDEYLFAATGEATTFMEEIAAYNGDPASLSTNMKDCFDVYDDDLKLRSTVKAAMSGYSTSKYNKALNYAYDVAATICQAAAKQNVINLEAMLADDFGDAEDKAMAYIEDNIKAGITAAQKGKTFNFKFDSKLMDDPAVATAFSMGIRANFGNSFFAHPSPTGHQEVADAILETIDFETTGQEAAAAEMSGMMNDVMALLLNVSPVMFDSQKQIANKLKKAVNQLDSYAASELDSFTDVRAAYKGKTSMNTVLNNIESNMKALRKEIKNAKNAVGTLSTAVNNGDIAGIDKAAATLEANMIKVDAAVDKLDASVKAAVKKARELRLDNTVLKPVAAEMSNYVSLAYATTGIMKNDSRQVAFAADEESHYVALGDGTALHYRGTGSLYAKKTYGYLLKEELGISSFQNEGVQGLRVDDLLYILDETYVPDAYGEAMFGSKVNDERKAITEEIENADLITVGFSNNTILEFAIEQMIKVFGGKAAYELDWSRYLDEASISQIDGIVDGLEKTLTDAGMGEYADAAAAAIESYLYAYLGFFSNYQAAMNKIHDINPDAKIVLVGAYNPLNGTNLVMGEEKLPLGEYMGTLTDLMNLQLRGFAMMTGKATYAEPGEVEVASDIYAGDIDMISFATQLIFNGVDTLSPSNAGHESIKDQLKAVIKLVDADTAAAMDKMAGLYDVVNITTSGKISAAEKQIKAARSAYDALTDAQKATVDADLLKLLEFYESDFDYVKALAVANSSVSSVKAKLASKTKLTITWSGVTGATGYTVKIYRNNALWKTVSAKSTTRTYSVTGIYRGCTYKATVTPVNKYKGTTYTGKAKSYSVKSTLSRATITAKKSGKYVKVSSADQNSTGFQVQVSTSKTFKKSVTKKTFKTNYGALKSKSVALKKGTNYVRVRAYTTINGKTSYGTWSTTKKVKR